MKLIKVLIVDDSAVFRKILEKGLEKYPEFEVVGTAADPYIARDKIIKLNPDVITLDIEMPRMDGITFLKKLAKSRPVPTVFLSSNSVQALDLQFKNAEMVSVEYVRKPENSANFEEMISGLREKILNVAALKPLAPSQADTGVSPKNKTDGKKSRFDILAIGASTGGTEAIRQLLRGLPENCPGTVIVQHMPQHFTKSFAERLDRESPMKVKEAENGDLVVRGRALIAPGNFHMLLNKSDKGYFVNIKSGPTVFHQRPSIEVLFKSVANHAGPNAMGVILTGMGKDGAKGLLQMKEAGAFTIAQDEDSSVVFGMPKEAIQIGAANLVLPLRKIPIRIAAGI